MADAEKFYVDCSPLFSVGCESASDSYRYCLCQIEYMLKAHGFFLTDNLPNLGEDYVKGVYAMLDELHALPKETKAKYLPPKGTYSGSDLGETYAEFNYEASKKISSARGFYYAKADIYSRLTDYSMDKVLFPGKHDGLSFNSEDLFENLYERQNIFLSAFSKALDSILLEDGEILFSNFFEGGKNDFGTIRLLYYPESTGVIEDIESGLGAHTDWELFSVLSFDSPGLEYLNSSGWQQVPFVSENQVLLLLGDMTERFTNGYFKALPHRVKLATNHPRRSIIRFNAARGDTDVKPAIDKLKPRILDITGRESKYRSTTFKEHVKKTTENISKGIGSFNSATNEPLSTYS